MVVGEGHPYLSALVVLSQQGLQTIAELCCLSPDPQQLANQDAVEKFY